ncbi:phage portal protein [Bacillus infantis]|uniref:phage portal protein n=1 Tax=Bacillus infantis TaxID=324767 RepID=UPI00344C0F5A
MDQKFPPPPFDEDFQQIYYFRDLYEGDHENIFPRAQELAKETQVTKVLRKPRKAYLRKAAEKTSAHHYVVVNFSSVIAELPADIINRALGNISADTESDAELLKFVEQTAKASKVNQKIWSAIVQHQVDGGIAYRIRRDGKGTWFEWKPADFYFEHDDELGADIAWVENKGQEKFLRVERQRLEEDQLVIQQLVFLMEEDLVKAEVDIKAFAAEYNLSIPDDLMLPGINELMCGFLPNDETLLKPRGRSGLRNIDAIQEEINWTVTRDSIVFEKHGKPKLAIPSRLWDSVAGKNQTYYGERFVRSADLEVVSYDEKNGAVPMYITWDAKIEQSFKHVQRLIDYMMSISKTSAQAVGVNTDEGGRSAIAILYEWIQSVIKAEAIKEKFDTAIKEAVRKCIILENELGDNNYKVTDPVIEWADMLPKADSEKEEEEIKKFEGGVQSLETTIRNLHPDWSEKAIQAEVEKILEEKATDSYSPTFTQPPKTQVSVEEE